MKKRNKKHMWLSVTTFTNYNVSRGSNKQQKMVYLPFFMPFGFASTIKKIEHMLAMSPSTDPLQSQIRVFVRRISKKVTRRPYYSATEEEINLLIYLFKDVMLKQISVAYDVAIEERKNFISLMKKRIVFCEYYSMACIMKSLKIISLRSSPKKLSSIVDVLLSYR